MEIFKFCAKCGQQILAVKFIHVSSYDGKSPLCGGCKFTERQEIEEGIIPEKHYWKENAMLVGEKHG